MSMEDALPESVYNYRPQASLFKYETIQFNTVLLPEGVTQEMFLSLHGGSIRTSILKWVEAWLNNLAGKEHGIKQNEGQASDDLGLNSRAI